MEVLMLLKISQQVFGCAPCPFHPDLALFDVGAAFYTVDHELCLKWLEISSGLSGNFLSWVDSFLIERSLCVVHRPSRSVWVPAPYGTTSYAISTLLFTCSLQMPQLHLFMPSLQ